MDKSQGRNKIKELAGLPYALTSTAMVILLFQAGLGNTNSDISGDLIMKLYLPTIVLLTGIWVPALKVMRFIKRHNNSGASDL
jgi:hypothetical protein